MLSRLPSPLRRLWRLFEAKRALLDGAPERTLEMLGDPCLALSSDADKLRGRALELLVRSATQRAAEGRDASVARILTVVASEDPARAGEVRRDLKSVEGPQSKNSRSIEKLLAEMRAESGVVPPKAVKSESRPAEKPPAPPPVPRAAGAPLRFHLAIDDGGEFLVVSGASITIGHARSGEADIPLLADLESVHARLVWSESFHAGPGWHIEPISSGVVEVAGRLLGAESQRLADGDEVRLAPNLSFRFRLPVLSSSTALLNLMHGAESEGAVSVLLLLPGASGRVRIGPQLRRHVPITGLEHEVEMTLEDGQLAVSCEGGVRVDGPGAPEGAAPSCTLDLPPVARFDVTVNARPSQRPPFSIAIGPIEEREVPPLPPALGNDSGHTESDS